MSNLDTRDGGNLFMIAKVVLVTLFLIAVALIAVALFKSSFDVDKGIEEGTYFNGTHNVECHTIQVNHNNILGTYHFEKECEILEDAACTLNETVVKA